ncbi:MAG TPA: hypothetical protein VF148_16720 [Acidimicrobiia bacterium]
MNDEWYWHGMGPGGWLMMVAFWGVVIFGIFWASSYYNTAMAAGRGQRAAHTRGAIGPW